nr:GTPase IMAP family member 5 [Nothobranchius furzeri]
MSCKLRHQFRSRYSRTGLPREVQRRGAELLKALLPIVLRGKDGPERAIEEDDPREKMGEIMKPVKLLQDRADVVTHRGFRNDAWSTILDQSDWLKKNQTRIESQQQKGLAEEATRRFLRKTMFDTAWTGELTVHFFCVSFTFLFCSADGNPPTDQCVNHHCIIKHYPCFPPVPTTVRIVLLGKSGNGKSSLANTFLGTPVFRVTLFDNSKGFSQVETKCMNGKRLSLIDTPGLFDPGGSEKDTKPELTRCLLECAPGLHVFLIVLKVDKFTKQQQAVVSNIREYFSGDALKYAVVVFTHGDQLPEGMKIEEFVDQSEELKELVEKCGGRCHVFDCKYWKNNDQEDDYRSNQLQMAELLNTIDKILMENTGGYYTNTILKKVEREIQEEESLIQEASQDMSKEEIRELAKGHVLQKQLEGSRPSWIKIGLVVTGLLAAVSAVCIASMESPSEQTIAEEACESAAVEEVDEETIPAESFFYLFEQIFNPFNPFV